MFAYVQPLGLLVLSNLFMTTAWYRHLKYNEVPFLAVIFISWGMAFFEYCLAVPASRMGSAVYSAAQLKTAQEVITLIVFTGFSTFYLGQAPSWNTALGFCLIAGGAYFIFRG